MTLKINQDNTATALNESERSEVWTEAETQSSNTIEKEVGFQLKMRSDGRLLVSRPNVEAVPVSVQRCFPWSQPLSWLSLRDEAGNEIELIENLESVDAESARELVRALEESAFVFRVEAILSVDEEFELRQWKVRLREGERVFQTKLNSWPRELPSGGLLIQDVGNDLYLVPDLENMDPASAKILWAFLDD